MRDEQTPLQSGRSTPSTGEGVDSTVRRRLLLKSLGKGGAVVVAASPLKGFAAGPLVPTSKGTQCTVSGMNSSLASRAPTGVAACAGYAPRHFFTVGVNTVTPNGWPSFAFPLPSGTASQADLRFSDLFGAAAPATKVLEILPSSSTNKLAYFVAAYFNALLKQQGVPPPGGASELPYTTADVVRQYNNGAWDPSVTDFYELVLVVG